MADALDISQREEGSFLIISLAGSLDGHTFVEFEKYMNDVVTKGAKRVVVELSRLSYVASAGVGVLINAQQQLNDRGGNMSLVQPSAVVNEVFEILGLEALFAIHKDMESALTEG